MSLDLKSIDSSVIWFVLYTVINVKYYLEYRNTFFDFHLPEDLW